MKKLRPTIVMTNFLLSVCLASLIFCLFQAPAVGAPELKVELVNMTEEGAGQVQLTYPDGRIKLLPYRSHNKPLVVGSKVYIFTTKELDIFWSLTGIVVYDATRGRGQSFPLPEDLKLNPYFSQPSFSPDGTKIAYHFVFQHERKSQPKEIEPELKEGFIDRTGKAVAEPVWREKKYHDARSFSEGLAGVNLGGKWGYGKWGFIDKTKRMVIPAQYDDAGSFSEGLAWVAVEGKYGFIDQEGKMVIPPQYDYVDSFSQGVASVRKGSGEACCKGGVRVRSWPDWRLIWESPLCPLRATDVPPLAPIWETKSRVEFYPLFFDPPRFLSFQMPENVEKQSPEKNK